MIDLHSHSTASDGRLSPTKLVETAARRGLSVLALTDHDTTAGLAEAQKACQEAGITFVPGIEWEIQHTGEFHLLGLGLQNWGGEFQDAVLFLQSLREQRNRKIFSKMQEAGLKGHFEDIEELAQGGVVGRPHFARWLVNRGKVKTIQDAFTHFLGRGKLFYEPKAGLELGQALELIHRAGGVAVVAHPFSLGLSWEALKEQLSVWKDQGLDGLEAWHPSATTAACQRLEALAASLHLKVSAGSDFHGENRPDRVLGHTAGRQPISCRFYEQLFAVESGVCH